MSSSAREAKVMQIFEGTSQIQRVVISRALAHHRRGRIIGMPAGE